MTPWGTLSVVYSHMIKL